MRPIILASQSPRRRELLKQMGVTFRTVPSRFAEHLDHRLPAADMTIQLGLGKALSVARRHPEALVIGGDTIVTLNGKHLGKAVSKAEARRVLLEHSNQMVTVTSSVVLVCKALGLKEVRVDETKVFCRPADLSAIEVYLESGDWKDKAGAWGIQSGAAFMFEHIEGQYDTILGLPTQLLTELLQAQGISANPVALKPPRL